VILRARIGGKTVDVYGRESGACHLDQVAAGTQHIAQRFFRIADDHEPGEPHRHVVVAHEPRNGENLVEVDALAVDLDDVGRSGIRRQQDLVAPGALHLLQ
jgi:hypothetical protein